MDEEMSVKRLTMNEINTRQTLVPIGMVAKAETYHGTPLYSPVQPNQKTPTTSKGPWIIAPVETTSSFVAVLNAVGLAIELPFRRRVSTPLRFPVMDDRRK
jgi:hypothetical protein